MTRPVVPILLLLLAIPGRLAGGGMDRFAAAVTDFSLPNGLRFVVCARAQAPVVGVTMHVRAGTADDPAGKSGIAKMFERLFFHGSETIGTQDWTRERAAIKAADEAWARALAARRENRGDPVDAQKLEVYAKLAHDQAAMLSRPGFVSAVLDSNGIQLRAEATSDALTYSFLMPANRVEVCFKLLSEWLRSPQFRYLHQDLLRTQEAFDSRGDARAAEKLHALLIAEAFPGHPYGKGFSFAGADQIEKADVERFFRTWFTPGNIVLGVAGQAAAADIRRLGQEYFGKLSGPPAPHRTASEPAAFDGEKRLTEGAQSGSAIAIAFRRPPASNPDSAALTVLHAILSGPSGGRLGAELGGEAKLAGGAGAHLHYPGRLLSNLFILMAMPIGPPDATLRALDEVIAAAQAEPPSADELEGAKAWVRMRMLSRLDSPTGAALELARFHAEQGGWKEALAELDRIDAVTAEQVRDSARKYLLPKSRLVASVTQSGEVR